MISVFHIFNCGAQKNKAIECFRLSASGIADETRIHTHMCYSEFNDIIDAIGALDDDVIPIGNSLGRSRI